VYRHSRRRSTGVGWGLVGLGRAADTMIGPAITSDPNGRLVAVVSRDQGRADAFGAKHGADWAGTDYEAMLSNPSVDVVMITTPNAHHADQVVAAAQAGKHVVSDKPLGINAADARRALDACQKGDVQLGVMFESRLMPCFQEIRRLLVDGELGEILLIQADFSAGKGSHTGWRADPELAGLGSVLNLGVHTYDILCFLLDSDVGDVSAMFDSIVLPELEMVAMVLMRFANGTLAFVNSNEVTPMPVNGLIIHGSDGRIEGRGLTSPGRGGDLSVVTRHGERIVHYTDDDCWGRTIRGFTNALIDGHPFSPSGLDGLRSAELTDAIAASARTGATVSLSR